MLVSLSSITSPRLHRCNRPPAIVLVTLCFVHIILPFSPSSPPCPFRRSRFLSPSVHRARACSAYCLSPFLAPFPLAYSAREYLLSPSPSAPPSSSFHRPSVTCGVAGRKGARRTVVNVKGGREKGWFKRVNTSQLRSRRTLLGHWSDRDILHSFSLRPLLVGLVFSRCPSSFDTARSFGIRNSGRGEQRMRAFACVNNERRSVFPLSWKTSSVPMASRESIMLTLPFIEMPLDLFNYIYKRVSVEKKLHVTRYRKW